MYSHFHDSMTRAGLALLACGWLVSSFAPAAEARVLRVAADPNNLPFTNERQEGFENRIAELVAEELGATLEYMWWPQRRGFFRETVGSGRAHLVMGVPAGFERVLTTRPYYASTYVVVQRTDRPPVTSIDDPVLRTVRVGVQLAGDDGTNTPPAHLLSERGIVDNVRGYTLFGDYSRESPPSAIVEAVARGEIDLAFAWGPMAGYFARRQEPALVVLPLEPCDCPRYPLTYAIAVGISRRSPELRAEVDAVLERRAGNIRKILEDYDVPYLEPATRPEPVSTHASK